MTLAIYKAHLKLALRSPWPWAITGAVTLFSLLLQRIHSSVPGATYWFQQFLFPAFVLGQMLATVALARQAQTDRTTELFEALPYRPLAWVAGRFAAFCTVWLAASLPLWAVTFFRSKGLMYPLFAVEVWLLMAPVTLTLTTALPLFLSDLFRRGFTAYVIALLIFVACSFAGLQLLSQFNFEVAGIRAASNADFTLTLYFPISQTGLFPNGQLLVYNRIGATAIGLGLLAYLAWKIARRRREHQTRRLAAAWHVAMLAVVIVGMGTRAVGLAQLESLAAETARYGPASTAREAGPGLPQTAPEQVAASAVSDYRVRLTLSGDGSLLAGEAALTLPGPGAAAYFTLNQLFRVNTIYGPDGSPVGFSREGDLLTVYTEGKPGTYTVSYQGTVAQWRRDNWNGLRLAAHVTDQSVVLPVSLGWYPLPGLQTLAFNNHGVMQDAGIAHPATPFQLTVSGPQGLHFVSNADNGLPVTSAWLIGVPWVREEHDGIRYYISPANRWLRPIFGTYRPELELYSRLVPLGGPFTVVEVPDSIWSVQGMIPPTTFPGAMVVSSSTFGRQDNMVMHLFMTTVWWTNARTEPERQVYDVLRWFMADLYAQSRKSRVYMSTANLFGRLDGATTPEGKALLEQLAQFNQQHGLDATGRLLQGLHESAEPLTWETVSQAMGRAKP